MVRWRALWWPSAVLVAACSGSSTVNDGCLGDPFADLYVELPGGAGLPRRFVVLMVGLIESGQQ
jgi:hypothetical protein